MSKPESQQVGTRIHDGPIYGVNGCPRSRDDCYAIARYTGGDPPESFICCGETDHQPVPADHLRFCLKADHEYGVDVTIGMDERDAVHTASVLLAGLGYRGSIGLDPRNEEIPGC